jgi:flagellar hook-length control protein FliK
LRAALGHEQAATPAVPGTAPASAASPVASAAVTAAHAVPAAETSAAPAMGARPRSMAAARIDARQAPEIVTPGVPAPSSSGGEQGASPRDGRSSTDVFAPVRMVASARAAHVAAGAEGVQASAWTTRLTQAAAAPAENTTALTSAAAEAWGVPDQIVRGLHLQVRNGAGEAVIRLHPEHLGEVVVEMRVEQERVVATLKSDTPAVRAWIAAHRDDLEAGLADAGLRLDELRVSERESGQQRREPPQESETPKRRPRRAAGNGARFEILA